MQVNTAARLLALCVATLSSVLFPAGCGPSGAAFSDPAALFRQAREEIGTADSFRETGEITVSMELGPEEIEMTMGFDAVFEKQDDGEWIARMDVITDLEPMMGGGPGSRMKVEAYIVGGKMYMQMPGMDEWVYQERDALQKLSGMDGASPDDLSRMMESAREAELLEEGPDTVRYRLVPDEDKVFLPEMEEKARQSLVDKGRGEDYVEELLRGVREMLSGMEMTVTVEKRTGLIVGFTMRIDDFPAPAGGLLAGSGLGVPRVSIRAAFTVYDHGEDFGLALPEEARNALPMEEMFEKRSR